MVDTAIAVRGVTSGTQVTGSYPLASHTATTAGDYLLVCSATNYQTALSIGSPPSGVGTFVALQSAAMGNNSHRYASWLAPVSTTGAKTVTVTAPNSSSNIDVVVIALDPSGGTVTLDGSTTMIDTTSPFAHGAASPAGTRGFLVCAHGQVQFVSGATTAYGAAPSGMTQAAAVYENPAVGFQVCHQQLLASGSTGARSQTGSPSSVTGASGGLFVLRNDAPAAQAGPEPGRAMLAV